MDSHTNRWGRACLAATWIAFAAGASSAQPVGFDFDGDGVPDYPVSVIGYDVANPEVGAARIWSGATNTVLHTIVSGSTNTLFGWSVGSAGDLNGDGHDDLVVGEPLWSASSSGYEGRVLVYSGDDASLLQVFTGSDPDTGLGRYVTGIGDWNGDGFPDVAASGWDVVDTDSDGIGDDAVGTVHVFSGKTGLLLTQITDPSATESFGYSVFGIGDVTGDGKADIAITDPDVTSLLWSTTQAYGGLYVFEGTAVDTVYDLADAAYTIENTDSDTRLFGAQVDALDPIHWGVVPLIQVISLTEPDSGGVNQAPIKTDVLELTGTLSSSKSSRPSLKLAGDVNLDGVVDTSDLLMVASQMGSSPQALGVLPIADDNKDAVVDSTDLQVVSDNIGATTDVYSNLWSNSRLLSISAGGAGFGDTSGVSVNPGSGGSAIAPGIRPFDDCPERVSLLAGNTFPSIVPSLLVGDSNRGCNDCPSYHDSPACYACIADKSLSGGSVTANPEQPQLDETVVTVSVSGVTEIAGTLKCIEACGDEGTTVPTPLGQPSYIWEVLTKTSNGWPQEHNPNDDPHSNWPGGDSIEVYGGQPCQEKRAICWAIPSGPCSSGTWKRVGSVDIVWADFVVESETIAEVPTNRERRTIGVGEVVRVYVPQTPGGGHGQVIGGVHWEESGALASSGSGVAPYFGFQAPAEEGTVTVKATLNGCTRTIAFKVIKPTKLNYTKISGTTVHYLGERQIRYEMSLDLDPDTVSFYNVELREVAGGSTNGILDFEGVDIPHNPGLRWSDTSPGAVDSNGNIIQINNLVQGIDAAGWQTCPKNLTTVGGFEWHIPIEYRVKRQGSGYTDVFRLDGYVLQKFVFTGDCVTVIKDGNSETGCRTDPGVVGPPCP